MKDFLAQLITARDAAKAEATAITQRCQAEGRTQLTADEAAQVELIATLDERIAYTRSEITRSGEGNPLLERLRAASGLGNASSQTADWARRTAQQIVGNGREHRAISTGVLDVPALVLPSVTPIPWPVRLIDLFTNRVGAESNAIEYYVESARTNNAAVVADSATKPTSVFTVDPVQDHCRVVAHLSEPVPIRLLQDVPQLQSWLASEMAQGVLSGLEHEVVLGTGIGESFPGIMTTPGTTTVHFATDPVTSIRKGLTALQQLGEQPNGIALNPADAEGIDLTRWGSNGGFLSSGFDHPNAVGYGSSSNIFGDQSQIRRVISPSVPAGWAILADWNQLKLFVREGMTVMLNFWSEDLFTKNSYVVRAELRGVSAVIRPQAFAIISLHSGS